MSTHIAHGLNPSRMPSVIARIGSERLERSGSPKKGRSIDFVKSFIVGAMPFSSTTESSNTAFIAPLIIGGKEAKTAAEGKGVDKVVDSFKLERIGVERLGEDLMVCGYVAPGNRGG